MALDMIGSRILALITLAIASCSSLAATLGEISLQCDPSAWERKTLLNGVFDQMDIQAHRTVDTAGTTFLTFNNIDRRDSLFKVLRLCANALTDASEYQLKLTGFLPRHVDSTLRPIFRSFSLGDPYLEGAPKAMRVTLNRVSTDPRTAEQISEEINDAPYPIRTIIPQRASCRSLSCALILIAARETRIDGTFGLSKLGPPEFKFGELGNLTDLFANLKLDFQQYGANPRIVDMFFHATRYQKLDRCQLIDLGLIYEKR